MTNEEGFRVSRIVLTVMDLLMFSFGLLLVLSLAQVVNRASGPLWILIAVPTMWLVWRLGGIAVDWSKRGSIR